MYMYVCTCGHVIMCACPWGSTCLCACPYVYAGGHVCICMHTHMCMHAYVWVNSCACTHVLCRVHVCACPVCVRAHVCASAVGQWWSSDAQGLALRPQPAASGCPSPGSSSPFGNSCRRPSQGARAAPLVVTFRGECAILKLWETSWRRPEPITRPMSAAPPLSGLSFPSSRRRAAPGFSCREEENGLSLRREGHGVWTWANGVWLSPETVRQG